jgi:transposase InsO family protein/transposase
MGAIAAISKHQAAELMGKTVRSLERSEIQPAAVARSRNGKTVPLYDAGSLPVEAQKRLVEKNGLTAENFALGLGVSSGMNLSVEDRDCVVARYSAIEPILRPEAFIEKWQQCNGRRAELVKLVARELGSSRRTIYDWLRRYADQGPSGLVVKTRADKGRSRALNSAGKDFIIRAALPGRSSGELRVKEIFRAYNEEREWRTAQIGKKLPESETAQYHRYLDIEGRLLPSAEMPKVSYETLRRFFLQGIPEPVRVMGRTGVEAYSNTQEIISHRDLAAIQPLDYVVMDHRRLDIFCMVQYRGKWKLVRPWITAAIDMRTRKWLAWVIVETPSSDSIATVLKRVFIEFGAPRALYWDNGKDFRCQWLEGRTERTTTAPAVQEMSAEWRGVIGSLGVRIHHAIVKRARSKIIEPNFNRIANFDRTLPEWCGHKPGARTERFYQLIKEHEQWECGASKATPFRPIEAVAAIYSAEIKILNERELQGEGMRKYTPTGYGWMCPNEAWEILIDRVPRRTVPERDLQFCFAKRRELTVRNGELCVSFSRRDYHYRLLDSSLKLMNFNGRKVELAYDPLDLGEGVIYCDGQFVGIASCVELRRMGEDGFVQDEKDRRAATRSVKNFISTVHNGVPLADTETRINRRLGVIPERTQPARPEEPVSVPTAISAAVEASQAQRDFNHTNVQATLPYTPPPTTEEDDGSFNFFSGGLRTNG